MQNILNSSAEGNFLAQAAEVSNTGFEVLVNWRDRIGEDFSYNFGFNFSTNDNRVENVIPGFDGEVGGSFEQWANNQKAARKANPYSHGGCWRPMAYGRPRMK